MPAFTISVPIPKQVIHSSLQLVKNILHIIQSPDRHPPMPQNTVRRRQVKVEIRHRVLGHVRLARLKPKGTHALGLHQHLLGVHAVEGFGVGAFEELDGA